MLEATRILAFDFLQQKIDSKLFTQSCAALYKQSLNNPESNYTLDSILIIPFIHEFACGHLNNVELRSEVMRLYEILNGTRAYHHSIYIKLHPHTVSGKLPPEIQENINAVQPSKLVEFFHDRIILPITVYDLIHNAIVDLLSIAGFTIDDATEYSLINCDEHTITKQTNLKIAKLLSYFIGNDALFLQVNCYPQKRIEYIIS